MLANFPAVALSFPSVVYTVLLGIALVYWVFVLVGAGSSRPPRDRAADGTMDGALDGAADGAAHGALDGADGGGHVEAAHADAGDAGGDGHGGDGDGGDIAQFVRHREPLVRD